MKYLLNSSTETRLAEGVNSPETPVLTALESRLVEILTDSPEMAGSLTEWGFLLAEILVRLPWSLEASRFVDLAIAQREGGAA